MSNLQHMNVEKDPLKIQCGPDIHIHNSSTVGVYLTVTFFCKAVSTVDVAVVLPVEGGIYRFFFPAPFSDHELLRRVAYYADFIKH